MINMDTNKVIIAFTKGYRVDYEGNVIGIKGGKLKLMKNNGKYLSFSIISYGNNMCSVRVHRLQAYQKYKDIIFDKNIVVRHANGISTDNSYNNIIVGTQSENMMDIQKEKRVKMASNPKYNHQDIISDRIKGMSYNDIMKKYNISSKGTVSFICKKSMALNI